jgi:DNA mismatch endonuclease (patch repair protein)
MRKLARSTDSVRSDLMRRVRQKGTAAEALVAPMLRVLGLRYRRNVKSLPGSPDFANKTQKWAIFVNGCFWHHHIGCYRATVPKQNRVFWVQKFRANKSRDADKVRSLRQQGFCVMTIWECELDGDRLSRRIAKFARSLP